MGFFWCEDGDKIPTWNYMYCTWTQDGDEDVKMLVRRGRDGVGFGAHIIIIQS